MLVTGLGTSCREMLVSAQSDDDSGEVESAGHRHACDISGSSSMTGNTEADSVGWPCTLKRPQSLPCIHQLLILHTLGGGLPQVRQATSTEKRRHDPLSMDQEERTPVGDEGQGCLRIQRVQLLWWSSG